MCNLLYFRRHAIEFALLYMGYEAALQSLAICPAPEAKQRGKPRADAELFPGLPRPWLGLVHGHGACTAGTRHLPRSSKSPELRNTP